MKGTNLNQFTLKYFLKFNEKSIVEKQDKISYNMKHVSTHKKVIKTRVQEMN